MTRLRGHYFVDGGSVRFGPLDAGATIGQVQSMMLGNKPEPAIWDADGREVRLATLRTLVALAGNDPPPF